MPTFRYGARQFGVAVQQALASTSANVKYGGFQYLPTMTVNAEAESIRGATLTFPNALATAATTAAGGSMQVVLTQFNSAGNSQNSAVLFNQAVSSAAADVPLDVSSLCNWTLSAGDVIVLGANTNTIGIPVHGGVIFSCWVDAVTAQ